MFIANAFLANLFAVIEFFLLVTGVKRLSGPALAFLLLVPFGGLIATIGVLAWHFRLQLTGALTVYAGSLESLSDRVAVLESYERLVSKVALCAHTVNANLAVRPAGIGDEELARMLETASADLAQTFSTTTGCVCRVCVKQVTEDKHEKRAYARTVCRDHGPVRDPVRHYIDKNTDFSELMDGGKEYWYCKDVDEYPNYSNTSPSRTYHSVIVWPIRARDLRRLDGESTTAEPIVGFLCLDSEERGIFSEEAHVPIGFAVADGMARAFERRFGLHD